MAFVRNRRHPKSKKYRGGFTEWNGKQKLFTGTTNKAETLAMARRFEDDHRQIRLGYRQAPKSYDEAKRRLFAEVASEYLAQGRLQGGRGGRAWGVIHARMRESLLGWWTDRLGLTTIADLDGLLPRAEKALREFVCLPKKEGGKPRKPSGKTLQNMAESLRAFCIWAVDRGYLEADPLDGLAPFDTTPQTQRRAISGNDVAALLSKCVDHRRLLYEVAFSSGLRAGELRALTADHLDVEQGGLKLDAAWTKSRKSAFQPLASWLMDRLNAFSKTGNAAALYQKFADHHRCGLPKDIPAAPLLYVSSHPARDLEKDLVAAGLCKWGPGGKVDFHALRVAYVSFVLEAGASAKEAQTLARHSKPELTMNIYARARSERLAEVAEAVALNCKPVEAAKSTARTGTDDVATGEDGPATALLRHQVNSGSNAVVVTTKPDTDLVALKGNGGGGNRTRVPKCVRQGFYACSQITFQLSSPRPRDSGTLRQSQPDCSH